MDCRESSYFHTTMLCVFSNIIGGFILLHFNCDSEVPAEGTGYTSYNILAGTRLTLKTGVWCQDSWGPDQFPAPKSPRENNHYLFNSRF